MSVPTASYELAQEHGLLVLTQVGDNISIMNPAGFEAQEF